jgi:hypothetical protein
LVRREFVTYCWVRREFVKFCWVSTAGRFYLHTVGLGVCYILLVKREFVTYCWVRREFVKYCWVSREVLFTYCWFRSLLHTVAYLLHDEGVEADLVQALLQAVGCVDLPHLLVQQHLLSVCQLGAQDLIVELLWKVQRRDQM